MAIILLLSQDKDPNQHLCQPFNIQHFRDQLLKTILKSCSISEKTVFSQLKTLMLKYQNIPKKKPLQKVLNKKKIEILLNN